MADNQNLTVVFICLHFLYLSGRTMEYSFKSLRFRIQNHTLGIHLDLFNACHLLKMRNIFKGYFLSDGSEIKKITIIKREWSE